MTVSGWIHAEGTFEWALLQLREGKKVRRKDWPKDAYVYCYTGGTGLQELPELRTVGQTGEGTDTTWMAHSHHILARDWELYIKKCGECGQPKS